MNSTIFSEATTMEVSYAFDELQLPEFGEGALFYGTATLVTGDPRYDDSFVVQDIQMANGRWLQKPYPAGGGNHSQLLFAAISAVLYDERTVNGRHAALEWADAVSGNSEPVPMFKRRRGLRELLVRGANLQAAE